MGLICLHEQRSGIFPRIPKTKKLMSFTVSDPNKIHHFFPQYFKAHTLMDFFFSFSKIKATRFREAIKRKEESVNRGQKRAPLAEVDGSELYGWTWTWTHSLQFNLIQLEREREIERS